MTNSQDQPQQGQPQPQPQPNAENLPEITPSIPQPEIQDITRNSDHSNSNTTTDRGTPGQ